MPIQIQTALITLGGVILGFAASFLLQARQRKWALDDQKREFKRKRLNELSEYIEQYTSLLMQIQVGMSFSEVSKEENIRKLNELWGVVTKMDFSLDSELSEIYNKEFLDLINTKDIRDWDTDKISIVQTKMKMRINKLLEQTYK